MSSLCSVHCEWCHCNRTLKLLLLIIQNCTVSPKQGHWVVVWLTHDIRFKKIYLGNEVQHGVIFTACVCGLTPQDFSIKFTFKATVLPVLGRKRVLSEEEEGSFGEKHHWAAYHLHHLNRDYGNLQLASPGCVVTLIPLLSCLPRKPSHRLSQLTELFVQLLHRE